MIEKDLVIALKSVCSKVYPMLMPENISFPAITYQVIYDGASQYLQGGVFQRDTRIQVDIWSKSYSEVKSLKDAVVNKIVELKGGDIVSQDLYEDGENLYREMIDFKIRR